MKRTGLHPFSELMGDVTPERRARIDAEKVVVLDEHLEAAVKRYEAAEAALADLVAACESDLLPARVIDDALVAAHAVLLAAHDEEAGT